MSNQGTVMAASAHDHDHVEPPTVFGFWIYLMTDCILFATLFASFAVLRHQFAGGPTGKELFELPAVAQETAALLISSITYGFAMLAAHKNKAGGTVFWLLVTFLLGLGFITMEVKEFSHLIAIGAGPDRSAFLSSFFTLVATHGLHVTCGLIWILVMIPQVLGQKQFSQKLMGRLTCLSLFWHFLDIVWICVFTFVYLLSAV